MNSEDDFTEKYIKTSDEDVSLCIRKVLKESDISHCDAIIGLMQALSLACNFIQRNNLNSELQQYVMNIDKHNHLFLMSHMLIIAVQQEMINLKKKVE